LLLEPPQPLPSATVKPAKDHQTAETRPPRPSPTAQDTARADLLNR